MGKRPNKQFLLTILPSVLIALIGCGPVHQVVQPTVDNLRDVKKLAVVVPSDGSFTVILDRATATAAPAILFGLIGVAVASALNQSRDDEKTQALAPHLTGFSSRSVFLESFNKALKDSGRLTEIRAFEEELDASEGQKYDAVLTLNIKDWGLRLPSRTVEQLAGFIELEAKMVRTEDNQTLWDEHDTVLGQGRGFFSEYKDNGNLLRNEIKETVQSAGSRIATRIAYPRGRKQ